MKKIGIVLIIVIVGCSSKPGANEQPTLVGPCGYLTKNEVEEVFDRKLDQNPAEINEEYLGGTGCSYSAGNDSEGNAYFAYVTLPSKDTFEKNKIGSEPVGGVGDEAYRINGPDAQQLWVHEGGLYVMVAIGDVPNPEGSKKLALLVLNRIQ